MCKGNAINVASAASVGITIYQTSQQRYHQERDGVNILTWEPSYVRFGILDLKVAETILQSEILRWAGYPKNAVLS